METSAKRGKATALTDITNINLLCQIRSLMHDYLATDGDSSFRSRTEENDSRHHQYTGNRDKNKVSRPVILITFK